MWGALCSCCLQGTEVFTATQAPFPPEQPLGSRAATHAALGQDAQAHGGWKENPVLGFPPSASLPGPQYLRLVSGSFCHPLRCLGSPRLLQSCAGQGIPERWLGWGEEVAHPWG